MAPSAWGAFKERWLVPQYLESEIESNHINQHSAVAQGIKTPTIWNLRSWCIRQSQCYDNESNRGPEVPHLLIISELVYFNLSARFIKRCKWFHFPSFCVHLNTSKNLLTLSWIWRCLPEWTQFAQVELVKNLHYYLHSIDIPVPVKGLQVISSKHKNLLLPARTCNRKITLIDLGRDFRLFEAVIGLLGTNFSSPG